MSRKKKSQKAPAATQENAVSEVEATEVEVAEPEHIEETQEVKAKEELAQEIASEPVKEEVAEPKNAQEEYMKKHQLLHIQDAAQRYIVGYNPGWYPSLYAHAKAMGISDQLTEADAKTFFKVWGAKVK